MTDTSQTEWLSGNRNIAFPFRSSTLSAGSPVPTDLLLDFRLFLTGTKEIEVFLSSLQYIAATDTYTLIFSGSETNETLLSGNLTRLRPDGGSRVMNKQSVSSGPRVALFTPGERWDDPSWNGAGDWTKTWLPAESVLETSLVNPGAQTFRRIFIDGLTIPDESAWPYGGQQSLVAGYNAKMEVGAARLGVRGQQPAVVLRIGPGLGLGYPPSENAGPVTHVATLHGAGPDKAGNINIRPEDCLRIFQPKTDEGVLRHRLQFGSDCNPCCPCGEYLNASRAVGRRSAKIKDLCNDLSAQLKHCETIYNDTVAEVNARRHPLAVVRSVRATGSHVKFTVQNMTDLPIFAYVAFDVLSPNLGPASVTQANVVQVSQGASIYDTISAHKAGLQALPFHESENPLAAFPTAKFSADPALTLLCVGQKTAVNNFAPISPGTMVEVVLNFAVVEAAVAGAVSPGDVRAASAAGRLPSFKFRTVAVYGLSHCYACSSETHGAKIVPADEPDDAFDTRCDTQFANDYKTVELPL